MLITGNPEDRRKKVYGGALLITIIAVSIFACIQMVWFANGEFDLEYLAYRLLAMVGIFAIISLGIAMLYKG